MRVRRLRADIAVLLTCSVLALTGCGTAGGRTAPAAVGSPRAPTATGSPPANPVAPSGAPDLLGSAPATLDALRAAEAQRPVSVLVPGVAQAAPVQARTTDPVSGGFDLPHGASDVAWWASGAVPGTGVGSVVLAAHVSYDGETGPFTRLSTLAPGSQVVVVSADGSRHVYAVQTSRSAPKTSLDRAELFRTTGPPALVMVTCGGAYDRSTHTFAENIVVTAVPV